MGMRDSGQEETLGSDGCAHYLDYSDSFMDVYVSELTQLHTLNMCSSVYANYTSMKLIKKRRTGLWLQGLKWDRSNNQSS